MTRVAILISGSGSNMVTLVKAMQTGGWAEPVLVLSNKEDAAGLDKARALGVPAKGIPIINKDKAAQEAKLQDALIEAGVDLVVLAGYMRVLSPEFVGKWANRMLNIHPSLLPKYKGLHTHQRAIDAGDKTAGCSVHLVTPELDDGPVLGQAEVPILPDDTSDSLAARVLIEEHKLYPAVLERFIKDQA